LAAVTAAASGLGVGTITPSVPVVVASGLLFLSNVIVYVKEPGVVPDTCVMAEMADEAVTDASHPDSAIMAASIVALIAPAVWVAPPASSCFTSIMSSSSSPRSATIAATSSSSVAKALPTIPKAKIAIAPQSDADFPTFLKACKVIQKLL
jgi:hypothetical protein